MPTAFDLNAIGSLDQAKADLQARLRGAPTDVAARFALGELLLIEGAWDRADTLFDLVSTQAPDHGVRVALIRQLIRGEIWRAQVFGDGRAPEMLGEVEPQVERALRILVEARAGGPAAQLREEADAAAPALAGVVNGRAFEGVRDLDDRTADVLEVLTSNGKYFWIPWSRVRSLELDPPGHVRDLIWRPARLDVRDGPEGVVYIPATYWTAETGLDDETRLARRTDWIERDGLTLGQGQRCLLVGDDVVALGEIESLALEPEAVS